MNKRRRYQKLAMWAFKYVPFVTAVIMLIHVILLLFGIRIGIADCFCGISIIPLIPAILLSYGLGFCFVHRSLIYYTALMDACIGIQNWVGFGSFLDAMHWIMLVAGIAVFILFFIHLKEFKTIC